jgi:hypothetical protein
MEPKDCEKKNKNTENHPSKLHDRSLKKMKNQNLTGAKTGKVKAR